MKHAAVLFGVAGALVLVAIVGIGLLSFKEACRDFKQGTITINNEYTLNVALAESDLERKRGLIGCADVPQKSGMYFPYATAQEASYWMKGMVIPIDIVWIANGKVVDVEVAVPPIEKTAVDPPIYRSPGPVTAVLEVGAGKAAEYGLTPGTLVLFASR